MPPLIISEDNHLTYDFTQIIRLQVEKKDSINERDLINGTSIKVDLGLDLDLAPPITLNHNSVNNISSSNTCNATSIPININPVINTSINNDCKSITNNTTSSLLVTLLNISTSNNQLPLTNRGQRSCSNGVDNTNNRVEITIPSTIEKPDIIHKPYTCSKNGLTTATATTNNSTKENEKKTSVVNTVNTVNITSSASNDHFQVPNIGWIISPRNSRFKYVPPRRKYNYHSQQQQLPQHDYYYNHSYSVSPIPMNTR